MARRTPSAPVMTAEEYAEIMAEHGRLNPEWQQPLSERAEEERKQFLGDKSLDISEGEEVDPLRQYFATRVRILLDQYRSNEHWQDRLKERPHQGLPVAATKEEARKAPRTYIKTVQEVLTPRTATMDFSRDEAERSPHPIVDPARLTPALLRRLGLDEFVPPSRTRKLPAMIQMANAIPDIQGMQSSIEPLSALTAREMRQARSFRLMRVTSGKKEGYIRGTQENHGKKIIFETDIHGAERRIREMRMSYKREIQKLHLILSIIADVDHQVAHNWQETKQRLPSIRAKFVEVIGSLQFCSDPIKKKMLWKVERCLTLESERVIPERRGQLPDGTRGVVSPARKVRYLNPGAKRAIWNTLKDDVALRIHKNQRIMSLMEQDEQTVRSHIEAMRPRSEFYDTVEEYHERFRILDTDTPLSDEERDKIERNLKLKVVNHVRRGKSPGQLFEPYLSFGNAILEHTDKTRDLLNNPPLPGAATGGLPVEGVQEENPNGEQPKEKDPQAEYSQELARSFMRIYLLAKIEKFYIGLQEMYDRHLVTDKEPNFDAILRDIHELNTLLAGHRVKPDIKVPDFDALYGELYHLLNSLRKKAREGSDLVRGEESDLYESTKQVKEVIKDRIKSFRFDLVVSGLS